MDTHGHTQAHSTSRFSAMALVFLSEFKGILQGQRKIAEMCSIQGEYTYIHTYIHTYVHMLYVYTHMQTHSGGGVQGLEIEKQMSRYRKKQT